jgi:prophage DNA circulation protein
MAEEKQTVVTWQEDGGQKLAFPVTKITVSGGNRIIARARPYRNGAKLDNTGQNPHEIRMEVEFNNTIREPGLSINAGEPLYPGIMMWLMWAFENQATGDLEIPTWGPLRAQAGSWDFSEDSSESQCAKASLTFIADNEDDIDAASLGSPTIHATAAQLADTTDWSTKEAAAWDGSVVTFKGAMRQLETLMNAPREMAADIEEQINMVTSSCRSLRMTFKENVDYTRNVMLNPEGNLLERLLVKSESRALMAKAMARREKPKTMTVVFEEDLSMADIAAMLDVSFEDVLYENPQIEDPMFIPRGTPVNIPDNGKIERHS